MSLQFSRSLRSLRVDSFQAARIGLFLAILLMGALLSWFFFAKVTLYENSTAIVLEEDGMVTAAFREEGWPRIHIGQSVVMRIDLGAEQPTLTLPGMVYDITPDAQQAKLYLMGGNLPPAIQTGKINGRAEVEVEYLTPAQLLLRATGKYLDANGDIPVSPQYFPTRTPQGGS